MTGPRRLRGNAHSDYPGTIPVTTPGTVQEAALRRDRAGLDQEDTPSASGSQPREKSRGRACFSQGQFAGPILPSLTRRLCRAKHACMLSRFSRVRLFVTPQTVALQAPLSMGFSRQEYWRGLPGPSLGDLPNPGIKPASSLLSCIGRWVLHY